MGAKRKKVRARKATAKVLARESRILGARFIEIMSRLDMPGCTCPWCDAKHPNQHHSGCVANAFILVSVHGTQS